MRRESDAARRVAHRAAESEALALASVNALEEERVELRGRLAVLAAREEHLGTREKAIAHTLAEEERRAGHLVRGDL